MFNQSLSYRFILHLSLALITFFYSGFTHAQKKQIDSLKLILSNSKNDTSKIVEQLKLSRAYNTNKDYTSSIQYAEESLTLSQDLKFRKGEALAYHWLGTLYRDHNKLPEARKNYYAAIKIREETGDSSIADVYLDISRSYIIENNFPEGIKNSLKALELNEKAGDRYAIARTYRRLGYNYMSYGNINEAIRYYSHSLALLKETNKDRETAVVMGMLGRLHLAEGNDSLATQYVLSALSILENLNEKFDIAFSNFLQARFYLTQSKIELEKNNFTAAKEKLLLAEKKCLSGMDFYETSPQNEYDRAANYNILGEIYMGLGNFSKARYYLETGNRLNLETKNRVEIVGSFLSLYQLDSLQGNYSKALSNFKQYVIYRDSIASSENTAKMENSQMQYAFNKKEDSLKQKQLVTQVKLEAQQKQKYFYWIGLGLLGLLSFFVYKNFRNQKKINRLTDESHAREKAELEL
ncbi:MAG TPA: tetratricopeptide repeat protein, partial [Chitinophagaceae bacterium]|nr:tetratricopeptide repeat protein [Chitinophagaceae bacterium]